MLMEVNCTFLSFSKENILVEYIKNRTLLTEFYLKPFFISLTNRYLVVLGILLMYLLAVLGNLIITTLVCLVSKLHTPMYFFLCNLSVEDIVYVSTVIPKLLVITITGDTSIPFSSCIKQIYLFVFCMVTEFFLLTTMAYDRYVAICIPLRYSLIMNKIMCTILATFSWLLGAIMSLIWTLMVSNLLFCDVKNISHLFCDPQTVLKLSCSDTTNITIFTTIGGIFLGCCPFVLILTSYMFIISTILKIQTSAGRSKSFSSCSSHLIVVIVFYGSSLSMNMKPKFEDSAKIDQILSLLYIVLVPALNPLVYSLRNREVLQAMEKYLKTLFIL